MNRVVITGIGVASPVGLTLDRFWSALVEGKSGIPPLTIVPPDRINTRIAAEISDFDPLAHFDPKFVNQLDRYSQFAIYAAREAMRDSGLVLSDALALETATIVGNGAAGQTTTE